MTVEVAISGRNLEITQRLREYAESKIGKLDRYLPELSTAQLDLTVEQNARNADDRQVAQLTLHSRGKILRAEERTADMFASIDMVLDKIHRQIERYKGKRYRRRSVRGQETVGELLAGQEFEDEFEEEAEEGATIIRRKRFQLAPMSELEAIEQMTLLGHDSFFVFYNAETAAVNVLYKRRDGNYGLIEPEVA